MPHHTSMLSTCTPAINALNRLPLQALLGWLWTAPRGGCTGLTWSAAWPDHSSPDRACSLCQLLPRAGATHTQQRCMTCDAAPAVARGARSQQQPCIRRTTPPALHPASLLLSRLSTHDSHHTPQGPGTKHMPCCACCQCLPCCTLHDRDTVLGKPHRTSPSPAPHVHLWVAQPQQDQLQPVAPCYVYAAAPGI